MIPPLRLERDYACSTNRSFMASIKKQAFHVVSLAPGSSRVYHAAIGRNRFSGFHRSANR